MDKEKIIKKFGKEYQVDDETFIMGIRRLLGDHIARRFKGYKIVLDSCCGAGFMSIALAKYVNQVIAVEINPKNLEQAQHNARIADVFDRIKFISGDILNKSILDEIPSIDAAFLDPDWAMAGKVKTAHTSKLSNTQPSADKLFTEINKLTQNIALRLPREIDLSELKGLPTHEFEKIYLDDEFKFYCVYFGELLQKVGDTEFKTFSLNRF